MKYRFLILLVAGKKYTIGKKKKKNYYNYRHYRCASAFLCDTLLNTSRSLSFSLFLSLRAYLLRREVDAKALLSRMLF